MESRWDWHGGRSASQPVLHYSSIHPAKLLSSLSFYHSKYCQYCLSFDILPMPLGQMSSVAVLTTIFKLSPRQIYFKILVVVVEHLITVTYHGEQILWRVGGTGTAAAVYLRSGIYAVVSTQCYLASNTVQFIPFHCSLVYLSFILYTAKIVFLSKSCLYCAITSQYSTVVFIPLTCSLVYLSISLYTVNIVIHSISCLYQQVKF